MIGKRYDCGSPKEVIDIPTLTEDEKKLDAARGLLHKADTLLSEALETFESLKLTDDAAVIEEALESLTPLWNS